MIDFESRRETLSSSIFVDHRHYWDENVVIETESNSRGTNIRIRVTARTLERAVDLYRSARSQVDKIIAEHQ